MINNHDTLVSFGQTVTSTDNYAQITVNFNLNNPKVAGLPNTPGCYSAYKTLVCTKSFMMPDGTTQECKQTCTDSISKCGILATHYDYLACATTSNADRDTAGPCGTVFNAQTDTAYGKPATPFQSTSGAFAGSSVSLSLVTIVSLLAIVTGFF